VCAAAAVSLGFADTTVSDDGQHGVSYDPKGCYYEGGSLKYNSAQSNTGSCTSSDMCLCQSSAQYQALAYYCTPITAAPTPFPTPFPTPPTRSPTPSPTPVT
jgi:hypothetical protein